MQRYADRAIQAIAATRRTAFPITSTWLPQARSPNLAQVISGNSPQEGD